MNPSAVQPNKCATCPFRDGSPYAHLRGCLTDASYRESRVCHSTGSDGAIYGDTGKPEKICRGSRDIQLEFFHGIGFLPAPTDAAWDEKCREMGIKRREP